MYKVQRVGSAFFVTVDTLAEAAEIAAEDANMNKKTLIIYERHGRRWFKFCTVSAP
jgi:hypothetical protein